MTAPDRVAPSPTGARHIGRSLPRLEDGPLVTGRGRFIADLDFPHQLHARIVRSPHAHGRLLSVATDTARAAPGVVAVWTSEDLGTLPPIPFRATAIEGLPPYRQPVLAREAVRFVGEPVAVVLADTAARAEDAADLVFPEIEPLPPLLDATAAPGSFAPGLGTEPVVIRKGYGDVDAAFAAAPVTVALDLSVGRHSAIPLETRGALARFDAARGVLELHGATKRPHWNRDQLAEMLELSPADLVLIEHHVGGGFGVRGEIYPEDVLVCLAALRLGRPVKWVEDRREHMLAANHSREQSHRIRAAVDAEGRLLAVDAQVFHDQGAYVRTHGARVADMTIGLLLGPYRVPAYRAAAHYRLTNKTPAATYRAPGRFEGSFVRERLMDAIAHEIGRDPLEVRRVNLIGRAEMPFARGLSALETEVILDSGDYAGLLDKALAFAGWDGMQERAQARRAAGEAVGIGLGMFVEKSGLGPSDMVTMEVGTDGRVSIVTGAASLGQGMETAIAQIAADGLGIDYRRIRVIHGDTSRIPHGWGAHASRVTVMTGEATRRAAETVRARALEVASEMLQCPAERLELIDGHAVAEGGGSVSLGAVAAALGPGSALRGAREPGLSATGWFHNSHMNYPYGMHIAQVRVDRETGHTAVEDYVVAYDIGRAVNPAMVKGQIVGGLAQGLGGALLEEFRYDAEGQPLSATLADYLTATAAEMPPVRVLITEDAPSPLNPLGLKGAGEAGVNAAGAAIAAAIDDALQMPGLVTALPVTPQRLRALIRARSGTGGACNG